MTALWSWRPGRKASREHIRHFVKEAVAAKQWAAGMPENWNASDVSRQMLADRRRLSVRALARRSLEYTRYRAFLGLRSDSSHSPRGWPWDRPAHDLWKQLERQHEQNR